MRKTQVKAMNLVASLLLLSREHMWQNIRLGGWKRESQEKNKIIFASILGMAKNGCGFSFFPVLLFPSSWVHEKKKKKRKQKNDKMRVTERKPPKSKNSLACFPVVLSQQHTPLKWCFYYLI